MTRQTDREARTCPKCLSDDMRVVWHPLSCTREGCSCTSECGYGAKAGAHEEHLHVTCRGCGFEWVEDTADNLSEDAS